MKLWISATVLLLSLTACGGDNKDEEDAAPVGAAGSTASPTAPTSSASDEDALEQAYRTYIKAFLTGDAATAYGLLSERCRDKEPLSEFASISESAADIYGLVDYTIDDVTVDGDEGKVDATYAVEALNSGGGSLWVIENGNWRTDKCD